MVEIPKFLYKIRNLWFWLVWELYDHHLHTRVNPTGTYSSKGNLNHENFKPHHISGIDPELFLNARLEL